MKYLFEPVGNVNNTAVAAVEPDAARGLEAVVGIPAGSFEEGVNKIRAGIVSRTNNVMSYLRLMQQMLYGDSKFEEWVKETMKQVRCD